MSEVPMQLREKQAELHEMGLSNSKFSILDANSSYKPHGIKSIT